MARKSRRSLSLASRLIAPFRRALNATGNSARNVGRTAGKVAGNVLGTVGKIGTRYAKATDNAISNVVSRRNKRNGTMRRRRNNVTRRANRR